MTNQLLRITRRIRSTMERFLFKWQTTYFTYRMQFTKKQLLIKIPILMIHGDADGIVEARGKYRIR